MGAPAQRVWDTFVPENDRRVAAAAGYGRVGGLGQRPVVLAIDMNVGFCGDRPEPAQESIKRWRNSAGAIGWRAAASAAPLISAARAKRIPIIYTTGQTPRIDGFDAGRGTDKNWRRSEDRHYDRATANEIIGPIAPDPLDILIAKPKYSSFFGTPLLSYLIDLRVDTLVVFGTATSGCVRASVVDAYQYNYRVAVVEEATFDRLESSHLLSLFDMNLKHADVMNVEALIDYVDSLPAGLFDQEMPALALTHGA